MTESVLRWLVRETWKPVAGRSVTVFNALSGSNAVPDDGEWVTSSLPGQGSVKGEVVGMARVESKAKLENASTVDELIETVEARGEIVQWVSGWDPEEDTPAGFKEMPEDGEAEDMTECSECGESHADGACWDEDDENTVAMLDGAGDI